MDIKIKGIAPHDLPYIFALKMGPRNIEGLAHAAHKMLVGLGEERYDKLMAEYREAVENDEKLDLKAEDRKSMEVVLALAGFALAVLKTVTEEDKRLGELVESAIDGADGEKADVDDDFKGVPVDYDLLGEMRKARNDN